MKRPHVLINAAMTADGKIDSAARQAAVISSIVDSARVDQLRADVDAVLVGGRTLLEGDPRLTVKSPALRAQRLARGLAENPAKVGVVSVADLAPACRFLTFGPARKLIYTTSRTAVEQVTALRSAGAEVFVMGNPRVDLASMLASLCSLGMRTLLVEGGGTLIASLLQLNLVDELMLYIAPRIFGGAHAPTLVGGDGFQAEHAPRLELVSVVKMDDEGGILVHYSIHHKEDGAA
jgi:2,5-diamino-6-(ribosylamino)-4(3H)-pyrimidinone 5'-phosphate reductase